MTIVSGYSFQLYLITIPFAYAIPLYCMPIPDESDDTTEPTPYPNCGSSTSSERFGEIRQLLLSKLAGIEDADATEWSDLCRGAHGLLASATHLYPAVGVDVTIYVRVPDTKPASHRPPRRAQGLRGSRHRRAAQARSSGGGDARRREGAAARRMHSLSAPFAREGTLADAITQTGRCRSRTDSTAGRTPRPVVTADDAEGAEGATGR